MKNDKQQYCISARDRVSGDTDSITGPLTKTEAEAFHIGRQMKRFFVYFRVSKYPFKKHNKNRQKLKS